MTRVKSNDVGWLAQLLDPPRGRTPPRQPAGARGACGRLEGGSAFGPATLSTWASGRAHLQLADKERHGSLRRDRPRRGSQHLIGRGCCSTSGMRSATCHYLVVAPPDGTCHGPGHFLFIFFGTVFRDRPATFSRPSDRRQLWRYVARGSQQSWRLRSVPHNAAGHCS